MMNYVGFTLSSGWWSLVVIVCCLGGYMQCVYVLPASIGYVYLVLFYVGKFVAVNHTPGRGENMEVTTPRYISYDCPIFFDTSTMGKKHRGWGKRLSVQGMVNYVGWL